MVPSAHQTIGLLGPLNLGTGTPTRSTFLAGNSLWRALAVTDLGSGANASSTTFWRGDGVWAVPAGSGGGGSVNISGVPTAGQLAGWTNANTITGVTVGSGLQLIAGTLSISGTGGITGSLTSGQVVVASGTSTVTSYATFLSDSSGNVTTAILTVTPAARSAGVAAYHTVNIPADTGITASTEGAGFVTTTATRTWTNTAGTVALQRENFFAGPTYAAGSNGQTVTDVFTGYFSSPVLGANMTFTRPHTLGVVDATAASSAITGGLIVATTLGTVQTSIGMGGGYVYAGNGFVGVQATGVNNFTSNSTTGIGFTCSALTSGTGFNVGANANNLTLGLKVGNANAGAAAGTQIQLNNNGVHNFIFANTSSGYTATPLANGPTGEQCAIWSSAAIPLLFGTNATLAVTISSAQAVTLASTLQSTGNVGIGTTPIANYALYMGSSLSAAGSAGIYLGCTVIGANSVMLENAGALQASANSQVFYGYVGNHTVVSTASNFTGLTIYPVYIGTPALTGGGTITGGYMLVLAAPVAGMTGALSITSGTVNLGSGATTVGGTLAVTGTSTLAGIVTVDTGSGSLPAAIGAGSLIRAAAGDAVYPGIEFLAFGAGAVFIGRASGGTRASPTVTSVGQYMFAENSYGWDSNGWSTSAAAQVSTFAGSTWTTSNHETYYKWYGTPNASTSLTAWMQLGGLGGNGVLQLIQYTTAGILTNNSSGTVASLSNASSASSVLLGLLGSGSASSSTFLRGDGTWAAAGGGGTTTNSLTINSGGSGGASPQTFNGSAAVTISYNTVGAPSTGGTNASGSWGISVTGSSASCTGNAVTSSNTSGTSLNITQYVINQNLGTGNTVTFSTVTATSFNATSSLRYKTNIRPLLAATSLVKQLRGVIFDRLDGSALNQVGVIAEEVLPVIPSVVSLTAEGQPHGVDYGRLTSVLIESMKDIIGRLEKLEV